jgi:hypothetical protein
MLMPGDRIADLEEAIELLKAAFVQGRLTKDEFGTRVERALASQTYAELTEVTVDLPAGPMQARPTRQLARTRPQLSMNAALSAGAFVMLAALVGMLAAIVSHSEIGVISAALGIVIIGVLAFGAMIAGSWLGRAR